MSTTTLHEDLQAAVLRSIPSPFHHMTGVIVPNPSTVGRCTANVVLRENNEHPLYVDYFLFNDKINKVLCIEAVRWMRDLPEIDTIAVEIQMADGFHDVSVKRIDAEKDGGFMEWDELEWDRFLEHWDNRVARAIWVKKFSTSVNHQPRRLSNGTAAE